MSANEQVCDSHAPGLSSWPCEPETDICVQSYPGRTPGLWSSTELSDQEQQLNSHANQPTSHAPWVAVSPRLGTCWCELLWWNLGYQWAHVSISNLSLRKVSEVTHGISSSPGFALMLEALTLGFPPSAATVRQVADMKGINPIITSSFSLKKTF